MSQEPAPFLLALPYLVQFGSLFFLLLLGYLVGKIIETRHLRRLDARERSIFGAVPTNLENISGLDIKQSFLVTGSVVMASDYFKTFGAQLKTLVGGRLNTLETLMHRGRREALLRMREQAARAGAQIIINVRFETSTITRSERRTALPSVEVLCFGTALVTKRK